MLATTVTLVTLVLVIFVLAASLALSVAQLAAFIPTYQDSFTALVNDLRAWLASFGLGPDQLQGALSQINFADVAAVAAGLIAGWPLSSEHAVLAVRHGVHRPRRDLVFAAAGPGQAAAPDVVGALDGFAHGNRSYLLVSTVFGLIVAAIDAGFLWLVGCRYRCCGDCSRSSPTTFPTSVSSSACYRPRCWPCSSADRGLCLW